MWVWVYKCVAIQSVGRERVTIWWVVCGCSEATVVLYSYTAVQYSYHSTVHLYSTVQLSQHSTPVQYSTAQHSTASTASTALLPGKAQLAARQTETLWPGRLHPKYRLYLATSRLGSCYHILHSHCCTQIKMIRNSCKNCLTATLCTGLHKADWTTPNLVIWIVIW